MQLDDLRMILMLRCEGAARFLSDAQERRLHAAEWLALKGHLLACVWCRRYRAQLDHLARFAAQLTLARSAPSASTTLSEAAKDRIRRRLVEAIDRRDD